MALLEAVKLLDVVNSVPITARIRRRRSRPRHLLGGNALRRVALSTVILCSLISLNAWATPSPGVLKPDVQKDVIALIDDPGFERPGVGGWSFMSIGISPNRVTYRLMAPGDAEDSEGRAVIELVPRVYAAPGEAVSKSFAIRVTMRTKDEDAKTMVRRAIASIQKRDQGGLYQVTEDSPTDAPRAGRPGVLRVPHAPSLWLGLLPWLLWLGWRWLRRRAGDPGSAKGPFG